MSNNIVEEVFDFDHFFRDEEEKGNIMRKSSEISEEARQLGNKLYSQEHHDQNIHKNILLQYSKSIAFAPKDSEKLALAYSNRSVLHMHLHSYDKCMIDVNRALEITNSNELKLKLESRKETCKKKAKNLVEATKNLKIDEDKLNISMTPSKKLQSATESVNLEYNNAFGRYLVANRNIKPGEIIIAEKGYACHPEKNQIYLVCSHCLSFAWNGIPCDCCVFAIYCNETCKNEAWEEYHSIECPILKYLNLDETYRSDVILAVRMFIKAVKTEGFNNVIKETQFVCNNNDDGICRLLSNGVVESNKFRSCYNLHCHSSDERIKADDIYEIMLVFLIIKHTNIIGIGKEKSTCNTEDSKKLMELKNIFIKLRGIIKTNGFNYQWCKCSCSNVDNCQDNCNTVRGLFIAPCSSLINHSCMPNVNRFFMQKRKIVFYATQPIKKGEQLCCSYGPTATLDLTSRQNYILQNFNFTCLCIACKEQKAFKPESIQDSDMKIVMKIFSEFIQKYENGTISTFFRNSPDKWTVFSKDMLEQALTVTELNYKYFENDLAFAQNIPFRIYISHAFYNLYGENFAIPHHC